MRTISGAMSLFNLRETLIAEYLRDPETRRALTSFAGTDEGKNLVREYMKTPDGREFLRQLTPVLLEFLEVPPEAKQAVLQSVAQAGS